MCLLCFRPQSCASLQSMLELHPILWEVASLWTVGEVSHFMNPPLPMESFLKRVSAVLVLLKWEIGLMWWWLSLSPKWIYNWFFCQCTDLFNGPLLTGDHCLTRSCSSHKVRLLTCQGPHPVFLHVLTHLRQAEHYLHSCCSFLMECCSIFEFYKKGFLPTYWHLKALTHFTWMLKKVISWLM